MGSNPTERTAQARPRSTRSWSAPRTRPGQRDEIWGRPSKHSGRASRPSFWPSVILSGAKDPERHLPLRQQIFKRVSITGTVIPAVARISGRSGIPRVPGIADAAGVAQTHVDHHVIVQLTHVGARQFVHMRTVQLAHRVAAERMDVPTPQEANGIPLLAVDVVANKR